MQWPLNWHGAKKMYFEDIDKAGIGGDYPLTGDYVSVVRDKLSNPDPDTYNFILDIRDNPVTPYGIHPGSKVFEIAKWCDENLDGDWNINGDCVAFELEDEFMAFKLRWL